MGPRNGLAELQLQKNASVPSDTDILNFSISREMTCPIICHFGLTETFSHYNFQL